MSTTQPTTRRATPPPTTGMVLAVVLKVKEGIEQGNPSVVPYLDAGAVSVDPLTNQMDFSPHKMAEVIGQELAAGRW